MSGSIDGNILETAIDPNALDYLKKHGEVYILTHFANPQYTYYKIKGYDNANLKVEFKEFVEICKKSPKNSQTDFTTATFKVESPTDKNQYDLRLYLEKSGFSTINDWVKTLKDNDSIPECPKGHKTFYLYYVNTT